MIMQQQVLLRLLLLLLLASFVESTKPAWEAKKMQLEPQIAYIFIEGKFQPKTEWLTFPPVSVALVIDIDRYAVRQPS